MGTINQVVEKEGIVTLSNPHITDAVLSTLQKHYEGLRVDKGDKITLDLRTLDPKVAKSVILDITFLSQNPNLPLENLCSNVENYVPKNESQEELLRYARKLVELEDLSVPAGLFINGQPGVGKSHIAVAVAKDFMAKGFRPNFLQFPAGYVPLGQLDSQQVWILDDLNSPYSTPRDVFMQVSLNTHNTGGRLFVTSNMPYDTLMEGMTKVVGQEQFQRYYDRTKGMFKVLEVRGESNRQATAWFNK